MSAHSKFTQPEEKWKGGRWKEDLKKIRIKHIGLKPEKTVEIDRNNLQDEYSYRPAVFLPSLISPNNTTDRPFLPWVRNRLRWVQVMKRR